MSHIANQRIKKDGKTILPGQPISLTTDELAELPTGAVSEALQEDALGIAVADLPDDAFRQDGEIRAAALKDLRAHLGYDVTADQVRAAREAAAQ